MCNYFDNKRELLSGVTKGFAALYELGQYGAQDNGFSAERWGSEVTDLFLRGLQTLDRADARGNQ